MKVKVFMLSYVEPTELQALVRRGGLACWRRVTKKFHLPKN